MKLVLATRNPHKARELAAMLDLGLPVLTMTEIGFPGEIREDGKTFEKNARIKLLAAGDFLARKKDDADSGACCLVADDSGLEVDALAGAPGVWSARYAGPSADDKTNLQKLLREMKDVPGPKRAARFRCVLAARWLPQPPVLSGKLTFQHSQECWNVSGWSGGDEVVFEGVCEGKIGFKPKGENGFGYDPVFFPEGSCRTFAEMGSGEKNRISHRARAADKLKKWLKPAV